MIGPGDYGESVHETSSGIAGKPITFKAIKPWTASIRAFRIQGQHVVLDGLKLDRYSGADNTWGASIRIEPTGNHAIITNCWISDMPMARAHDFSFDATDNEIISPSSDFIKAGFTNGSRIYLGACGLDGLWYQNHDTSWLVSSNTATSMWVTNTLGQRFIEDKGSNYWAFIRPGSGSGGMPAATVVLSKGIAATNILFTGNTVSNWSASVFFVQGNGSIVEKTFATQLYSCRFINFEGSNHIIRNNVVRGAENVLHWIGDEIANIVHPPGAGWYDFQAATIGGFALTTETRTNILIANNWFEDVEDQLGRVDDEKPNVYDIRYLNNVFIGVSGHFSGGRDGMQWISNTFYRCAYDSSNPLQIGGRAPKQTNYVVRRNLFIECGPLSKNSLTGYYGVSTNALNPIIDFNMVAGAQISGWSSKQNFVEPNGINGGDPGFVSELDPDGPDNIPFTEDDGLRVLPNSLAAKIGGGAVGILNPARGQPIAHFSITSPIGWFEPSGTNYNPGWWDLNPTARHGVVRPFQTAQTIGQAPVTATFNADSSISGLTSSFTNTGITQFAWDFGDGVKQVTESPSVQHTFRSPGTRMITLTVRNTAGAAHSSSNHFFIGGAGQGSVRPGIVRNVRTFTTNSPALQ